jgi:hypothetical protein
MPAMVDRLAQELVRCALDFHRRRPWNRVPADAPFLMRVPEEGSPLAISIMGQGHSDYGVLIVRGPGGFANQARMILEDRRQAGQTEELDLLSATYQALATIPMEFRGLLQQAGFSARREQVAPLFLVKRPGRRLRPPNAGETRLLLRCLEALCLADETGELRVAPLDPVKRRVLELVVRGEPRAPLVRSAMVPWPGEAVEPPPLLHLGPGLEQLPRRGGRWFAALFTAPGSIAGDDRTVRVFALGCADEERLIAHEVVLGEELAPAAEELARVLRGEKAGEPPGLPDTIGFESTVLHDAFAPALAALGVRSELGPAPGFLVELGEMLHEDVQDAIATEEGRPLPASLMEWKEADRRFTERMLRELESQVTPRALARYFGSRESAEAVLEELAPLSPLPAFLEWLSSDYRATCSSRTLLEKRLARKRLPPVERALLEARRDAELSIYRVDACQPGATVEVEDIFTGERRTIHDSSLSGCDLEGFFVPLRLAHVAEWIFPVFAGPPLNALEVERVVRVLEEARTGTRPASPGTRPEAHLFGRIWGWLLESRQHPPQLQNTDGDPLEPVTAVFRVADAARLGRELRGRADIRAEDDYSWVWLRPAPPAPGMGENTVLGQLELHDDRLVLEVNSTGRLERARAWLEALPGVRFESSRAKGLDEAPAPDDSLPTLRTPLAPEVRAELEHRALELYRRWLDEPIPALGDLTPRACCRTPEGRRRVARLVRTLPPIGIPGGSIPPPRAMLLRELGLAD